MSFVDRLPEHWPDGAPDWVIALAKEADATSQNRAAAKLDRSAALVSQILRNRYQGDMALCEDLVRGALMDAVLDCPALGELALNECHSWRMRAKQFQAVNALRSRMYRACNRCPLNKEGANQ